MELGSSLWLMDGFRKGMFKQSDAGCLCEEKGLERSEGTSSVFTCTRSLISIYLLVKQVNISAVFHCFTECGRRRDQGFMCCKCIV